MYGHLGHRPIRSWRKNLVQGLLEKKKRFLINGNSLEVHTDSLFNEFLNGRQTRFVLRHLLENISESRMK